MSRQYRLPGGGRTVCVRRCTSRWSAVSRRLEQMLGVTVSGVNPGFDVFRILPDGRRADAHIPEWLAATILGDAGLAFHGGRR